MIDIKDHPLAIAACEISDLAKRSADLDETVRHLGIDMAPYLHLSQQRAMHCLLVMSGRSEELENLQGGPKVVVLDKEEQELLLMLTMAVMDGVSIGWRGKEIALARLP